VIEAVVFDLGKVLVDFDFSLAARKLAARGTLAAESVRVIIQESPALVRLESGISTNEEFYEEVQQLTGFRGAFAEFATIFADIFTPMDEMIALHSRVRNRGLPTYILSNSNDLAIAHIRRTCPFFSTFDGYVFSYEVKSMKPNPEIYEALERLTGKPAQALLYVDDRIENVKAGAARGWQVVHQRSPQETIRAFQALGLD
jgi:HAD superfamily hydrolase (TIGR01509 family)